MWFNFTESFSNNSFRELYGFINVFEVIKVIRYVVPEKKLRVIKHCPARIRLPREVVLSQT